MLVTGFRSEWPIQAHLLLLISSSTGRCCVFSHNSLLLMLSGQWIWRILLRQLLTKVCTLLMVVLVILHVSAPYNKTIFTLELNNRIFVRDDSTLELQMFFSCRNATLALPILALTSASVPTRLLMTLPRYVKVSTSSSAFPSSVIGSVLADDRWVNGFYSRTNTFTMTDETRRSSRIS